MENKTSQEPQPNPPVSQPVPETKESLVNKKPFILGIAMVLLLLVLGYFFYSGGNSPKEQVTQPTNSPVVTYVEVETTITPELSKTLQKSEEFYELQLPQGWSKTKESIANSSGTVRYEDTVGNFLEAVINPPGAGFASDEIWGYEPVGTGNNVKIAYVVACEEQGQWCSKGDNQLRIGIKSSDENDKAYYIKNNHYFFMAGNDRKEEGVDTDIYKNLVESIVFK